jgi:hypothetical protein
VEIIEICRGKNPSSFAWESIEDLYWEGVWWHNRGVLENTPNARAIAFGKAATDFCSVIARAEKLRGSCIRT